MKFPTELLVLLIVEALVTHCTASELTTWPLGVSVGLNPRYHPIRSLYHSQDKFGAYVYGYATPTITKRESSANGITQGGYSYIDSDGHLQTVEYVVDPIHGLRVAASNLPKEAPDVAAARLDHLLKFEQIKGENARAAELATVAYSNPIVVPVYAVPTIPTHQHLPEPVTDLPEVVRARNEHLAVLNAAYASVPIIPQSVEDLPEVVKARTEHLAAVEQEKLRHAILSSEINLSPIPQISSESVVPIRTVLSGYAAPTHAAAHNQKIYYSPTLSDDILTKYSYGYVGPHSSHSESRSEDGVTRGGYSYLDANGILQTVHYIADGDGFRVAASNIPVDPAHIKLNSK